MGVGIEVEWAGEKKDPPSNAYARREARCSSASASSPAAMSTIYKTRGTMREEVVRESGDETESLGVFPDDA